MFNIVYCCQTVAVYHVLVETAVSLQRLYNSRKRLIFGHSCVYIGQTVLQVFVFGGCTGGSGVLSLRVRGRAREVGMLLLCCRAITKVVTMQNEWPCKKDELAWRRHQTSDCTTIAFPF